MQVVHCSWPKRVTGLEMIWVVWEWDCVFPASVSAKQEQAHADHTGAPQGLHWGKTTKSSSLSLQALVSVVVRLAAAYLIKIWGCSKHATGTTLRLKCKKTYKRRESLTDTVTNYSNCCRSRLFEMFQTSRRKKGFSVILFVRWFWACLPVIFACVSQLLSSSQTFASRKRIQTKYHILGNMGFPAWMQWNHWKARDVQHACTENIGKYRRGVI